MLTIPIVYGIGDAETDPGTRVLALTGAGDRAFCAGVDLRAFDGTSCYVENF